VDGYDGRAHLGAENCGYILSFDFVSNFIFSFSVERLLYSLLSRIVPSVLHIYFQVVVKLKDLTLKEGDKLKIPIPGKGASKREGSRPLKSFGSFGALSPPPAPGSTVFSSATSTAARSSSDGPLPTIPASPRSDSVDGDEEWGEFS